MKQRIFAQGSKTYYNASKLFPKDIREEVTTLYAYVRTADNFVDATPQDKEGFKTFCQQTKQAWEGKTIGNPIIDDFIMLAKTKEFDKEWINSFLLAMASDLNHTPMLTMTQTQEYMYGSAEVIGLMMAKIMGVGREGLHSAKLLGRSMQYINFIRDIQEDLQLQRQYLPQEELITYGLTTLEDGREQKVAFGGFILAQLHHYEQWRKEAQEGFIYIPKEYRHAILLADALYYYTAQQIKKNPAIVFTKKIKPSLLRIFITSLQVKRQVRALEEP